MEGSGEMKEVVRYLAELSVRKFQRSFSDVNGSYVPCDDSPLCPPMHHPPNQRSKRVTSSNDGQHSSSIIKKGLQHEL